MQSGISIDVERAAIPEGTNLTEFVTKVRNSIRANYSFFGAKDKWSLWAKQIFTDNVIVHVCDGIAPKYFKADMLMDSAGNITFSNLQEVEQVVTYVPKTAIEREAEKFETVTIKRSSLFSDFMPPSFQLGS